MAAWPTLDVYIPVNSIEWEAMPFEDRWLTSLVQVARGVLEP